MPVLRSMDGKFYDLPDDQAQQFELPRDKVKELLQKAGEQMPPSQGGQVATQPQPKGGGRGQGAPGTPAGMPQAPVVIQVYAAPPGGGQTMPPSDGGQGGAPQQAPTDAEGNVDPYWIYYWWRNFYYRPWGNWGNW